MARLISLIRLGFRCALDAAFCGYPLLGALLLTGQAPPVRSITEGAYSVGQAARGQQLYKAQCAACHGNALEGTSGPPLVGDSFLSNWSAQPLANLIGKIEKTMPFNLPGSLSRSQSTDLGAYVLQAGKFPAGPAELSEAALAQIVFPTVRSSAVRSVASAAGASLPPPEGNLAELMRAIAFPNANIIFNVQLKDPGAQTKKQPAAAPFDYVEWGSTVYPGWLAIDQAAVGHRSGRCGSHGNGAAPFDAGTPLSERQARPHGSRRLEAIRCRTRGCWKDRSQGITGEEL